MNEFYTLTVKKTSYYGLHNGLFTCTENYFAKIQLKQVVQYEPEAVPDKERCSINTMFYYTIYTIVQSWIVAEVQGKNPNINSLPVGLPEQDALPLTCSKEMNHLKSLWINVLKYKY